MTDSKSDSAAAPQPSTEFDDLLEEARILAEDASVGIEVLEEIDAINRLRLAAEETSAPQYIFYTGS